MLGKLPFRTSLQNCFTDNSTSLLLYTLTNFGSLFFLLLLVKLSISSVTRIWPLHLTLAPIPMTGKLLLIFLISFKTDSAAFWATASITIEKTFDSINALASSINSFFSSTLKPLILQYVHLMLLFFVRKINILKDLLNL